LPRTMSNAKTINVLANGRPGRTSWLEVTIHFLSVAVWASKTLFAGCGRGVLTSFPIRIAAPSSAAFGNGKPRSGKALVFRQIQQRGVLTASDFTSTKSPPVGDVEGTSRSAIRVKTERFRAFRLQNRAREPMSTAKPPPLSSEQGIRCRTKGTARGTADPSR
jgi:hypothetical protein